jgi:hypothetical protein
VDPQPVKRPHYLGTYDQRSRALTDWARAHPATARCTLCHRLYAELPLHTTGRHPCWVAGHVNRGERNGALRLECSHCSNAEGGRISAARLTGRLERRSPNA